MKTNEDLLKIMLGKIDRLITEVTHIKEDNKELTTTVAEIVARIRTSKIEVEGLETGSPSTNNLSNLVKEQDSHKVSSELPKSNSINNKTTEILDINPETTISKIENDKSWDIINLRDEENLTTHQRLIDCNVVRNDSKRISIYRNSSSSKEAFEVFSTKLKTIKDGDYSNSFTIDSKSTAFIQYNTKTKQRYIDKDVLKPAHLFPKGGTLLPSLWVYVDKPD
ncbi:hypothetical protein ACO0OL_004077 [Hanseniaspora opuntiae]